MGGFISFHILRKRNISHQRKLIFHILRQQNISLWVQYPFWWLAGTRKGGTSPLSWCKKVSGGHFFSPWESPFSKDGSL
ncbi:MAG: hypothetical protein Q4F17_00960 [Eubacteriales bacterium]|nr:hypothetical protein [Eubacteriales bacterium]